jgi:hypothetical protein
LRRSGFDLAAQLWSRDPDIPVIYLADGTAQNRSTAEVVLPRPVDARLLMRAVLEQLGRVPAVLMTPHAARMAERLRDRLRNPMIRDVFDRWFKLSRAVGRVPTLAEAGELRLAENDNHVLMEVNEHPSALVFRVIQVGAALTARLGRDMTGEVITSNEEEDVLGSMSLAYRRCVGGHAHHDYAKMALGQGCRVNIDRLLMPVSHDSDNVTHMLGVIVISEIKS